MWAFKTCGMLVEQVEVVAIFENLLQDMQGIKCKDVAYEKYQKITKEIQTKLCFSEAESCIEAMVLQIGAPAEESSEPAAVGGEETAPEPVAEGEAGSFLQLQLKARARHGIQ